MRQLLHATQVIVKLIAPELSKVESGNIHLLYEREYSQCKWQLHDSCAHYEIL